jgi:hypothetical protein
MTDSSPWGGEEDRDEVVDDQVGVERRRASERHRVWMSKPWRDPGEDVSLSVLPALLGGVAFLVIAEIVFVSKGSDFFFFVAGLTALFCCRIVLRAVFVVVWWHRQKQG